LPPPDANPPRDRRRARPRAPRRPAARGDGGRCGGARGRHAARRPAPAARARGALHARRRRPGPAPPERRPFRSRGDPPLPPPVRRALRAGAARVRKILVVNLTRFGDLLQTSPTIVGLREQHPGAEIVVLVERNFADVARGLPGVDRVWELDLDGLGRLLLGQTGDGLREAYRLVDDTVRPLRAEPFDLPLNYSSSKMSAVLLKLIGAPDTRGWTMSADGHRLIAHPWSRLFAASCLHRRQAPFNLVDYYKRVAGVAAGPERLLFEVPADARRWAADFLAGAGAPPGAPLVAFQLGASRPVRRWPAAHFVALARALHAAIGARFLLCGGGGDRP